MMLALLFSVLFASAAEECESKLTPLDGRLSVSWVAPVGSGARRRTSLWVVPTAELARWVQAEQPSPGKLLRRLGQRRRKTEPKRSYMVTVFDVDATELCRPLDEESPPPVVGGVPSCTNGEGRSNARYSGCGYTTDRSTGKRGFDVYRIEWQSAAARGFCVLPLERFLTEAGTRLPRE